MLYCEADYDQNKLSIIYVLCMYYIIIYYL